MAKDHFHLSRLIGQITEYSNSGLQTILLCPKREKRPLAENAGPSVLDKTQVQTERIPSYFVIRVHSTTMNSDHVFASIRPLTAPNDNARTAKYLYTRCSRKGPLRPTLRIKGIADGMTVEPDTAELLRCKVRPCSLQGA